MKKTILDFRYFPKKRNYLAFLSIILAGIWGAISIFNCLLLILVDYSFLLADYDFCVIAYFIYIFMPVIAILLSILSLFYKYRIYSAIAAFINIPPLVLNIVIAIINIE